MKYLKNTLYTLFLVLMMVFSLALIFHSQVSSWLVKSYEPNVSLSQIYKNQKANNGSYDWASVKSVGLQQVASARASSDKIQIIGAVTVPKIKMNVAIAPGVDNTTLALAAGTMREDQKMGKGNYPLAAHHLLAKDALFSPLFYKAEKGQKAYVTDFKKTYVYEFMKPHTINKDDVEVTYNVPGKKLLTMVTCDATGDKRWLVQGKLVKVYDDWKDSPNSALKGFEKSVKLKDRGL